MTIAWGTERADAKTCDVRELRKDLRSEGCWSQRDTSPSVAAEAIMLYELIGVVSPSLPCA